MSALSVRYGSSDEATKKTGAGEATPIDLSDLEWSSRSTTYTNAEIGKKYLILTPTNSTNEGNLIGCTKIWSIRNYSNTYNAYLFYVEATATTIRVQNQGDSGYRYERVALIE